MCETWTKQPTKMDSEVTINVGKISQILAAVGNYSYQVEHILKAVKSLSTSHDITNESKSQEPQKIFLSKLQRKLTTWGLHPMESSLKLRRYQQILYVLPKSINQKKGIYMIWWRKVSTRTTLKVGSKRQPEYNTISSFNTFCCRSK